MWTKLKMIVVVADEVSFDEGLRTKVYHIHLNKICKMYVWGAQGGTGRGGGGGVGVGGGVQEIALFKKNCYQRTWQYLLPRQHEP